ncbi:tyrosine-type recombinase/integrase [Cellvibrio fibrivorans]|uniref:Integrase n=1 Tax=Cellvibrio fibrivorans TaxID=126350 RepID=A0ABU1V3S7_9GAMM|nr:integrase arm-type DNA-binding domain-containing protein [Cellvibrio fibrivorans]MDR7092096.1 integrase [Cellvibrio fibrivorans]
MAKATNKLTDTEIKQAPPKETNYKLVDGGGLYVLVKTNGSKLFQYDYRFTSKRKTLSIGIYPTVSLKKARDKLKEAKEKLANNIDPSQAKQLERTKAVEGAANTFAVIARDWWQHTKGKWKAGHAERVLGRLEADVFPAIGNTPITDLKPPHIKAIIRKIENRDALDVAKRVLQDIRRVFSYAVELGHIDVNPARELSSMTRQTKHRDALPPEELPLFLRELSTYGDRTRARPLTQLAIEFLLLTFVRSSDLREARWDEFDLVEKMWRIPAHRMKMKTDHIVPLAKQTIDVLEKIRVVTGTCPLVFPSEWRRTNFMSENTMRRAIFKLGYDGTHKGKSKCVPHGIRTTACSILNEQGFNPDAIERQMSHQERNGVRAAYTHHAQYKNDRIEMMQWWADHLDALRAQGTNDNVIAATFRKKAG